MGGHDSISIAVLTDSQDDVELINGTLRDAGHAAHCLWIVTPKILTDKLSSENIELIIINCERYPDGIRQVVKQKDCLQAGDPGHRNTKNSRRRRH